MNINGDAGFYGSFLDQLGQVLQEIKEQEAPLTDRVEEIDVENYLINFVQQEMNNDSEKYSNFFRKKNGSNILEVCNDLTEWVSYRQNYTPKVIEACARKILEKNEILTLDVILLGKSAEEKMLRHTFKEVIATKNLDEIKELSDTLLRPLPEMTLFESGIEKAKAVWNNFAFKVALGTFLICARPSIASFLENTLEPVAAEAANYLPSVALNAMGVMKEWKIIPFIIGNAAIYLSDRNSLPHKVGKVVLFVFYCVTFYQGLTGGLLGLGFALSQTLSVKVKMRDDRTDDLEDLFVKNVMKSA